MYYNRSVKYLGRKLTSLLARSLALAMEEEDRGRSPLSDLWDIIAATLPAACLPTATAATIHVPNWLTSCSCAAIDIGSSLRTYVRIYNSPAAVTRLASLV